MTPAGSPEPGVLTAGVSSSAFLFIRCRTSSGGCGNFFRSRRCGSAGVSSSGACWRRARSCSTRRSRSAMSWETSGTTACPCRRARNSSTRRKRSAISSDTRACPGLSGCPGRKCVEAVASLLRSRSTSRRSSIGNVAGETAECEGGSGGEKRAVLGDTTSSRQASASAEAGDVGEYCGGSSVGDDGASGRSRLGETIWRRGTGTTRRGLSSSFFSSSTADVGDGTSVGTGSSVGDEGGTGPRPRLSLRRASCGGCSAGTSFTSPAGDVGDGTSVGTGGCVGDEGATDESIVD